MLFLDNLMIKFKLYILYGLGQNVFDRVYW